MRYLVNYSKAQMKIQQMAFVLVAILIFFGMVALIYFSISLRNLRQDTSSLQDQEASEVVRKLASSAEFQYFSSKCSNCIDLDKALILKDRPSYLDFWNLDFLQIEKIYPESESKEECEKSNYPDCTTITIIDNENFGSPSNAYVSICRWEPSQGGYTKCEIGRIYASGKGISK